MAFKRRHPSKGRARPARAGANRQMKGGAAKKGAKNRYYVGGEMY